MSNFDFRDDIKASLDRWVSIGCPTGDFLKAVLCNDLMGAMGRADDDNRRDLFAICAYVYNELPGDCHGSPEIVKAWYERHLADRQVKEATNG